MTCFLTNCTTVLDAPIVSRKTRASKVVVFPVRAVDSGSFPDIRLEDMRSSQIKGQPLYPEQASTLQEGKSVSNDTGWKSYYLLACAHSKCWRGCHEILVGNPIRSCNFADR